jgi:hypothetical protein
MLASPTELKTSASASSLTVLLSDNVSVTLGTFNKDFYTLRFDRSVVNRLAVNFYDAMPLNATKGEARVTSGETDLISLKPLLAHDRTGIGIKLTNDARSITITSIGKRTANFDSYCVTNSENVHKSLISSL